MRPDDLRYSKEHEWIRDEAGSVTVGITDFASEELGDIVFLELPEVGRELTAGDPMGTIETVKAVEELYSPVSGTVAEVNEALSDQPELVNQDPFGQGWLIRIDSTGDAVDLLSAEEYGSMVESG